MLKENNIRGCLPYNKPELVDVLVKRGLLPEIIKITTVASLPERKDTKKDINPKYNFLKHIRNSSDEEYSLILLEFETFTRMKEDLRIKSKTSLEKTGNIETEASVLFNRNSTTSPN